MGQDKLDRERLPFVVREVGESGRRAFVETSLRNRGSFREVRELFALREEREVGYFSDLAEVIEEVVNSEVRVPGKNLDVNGAAVRSVLKGKRNS